MDRRLITNNFDNKINHLIRLKSRNTRYSLVLLVMWEDWQLFLVLYYCKQKIFGLLIGQNKQLDDVTRDIL